MKKKIFVLLALGLGGLIFGLHAAMAQKEDVSDVTVVESNVDEANFVETQTPAVFTAQEKPVLTQEQNRLATLNKSLTNLVNENQKLTSERDTLQEGLERLRGERMIQDNRLNALVNEREGLAKKSKEIESLAADYEKRINELEAELALKRATPEFQEAKRIQELLGEGGASTSEGQRVAVVEMPPSQDQEQMIPVIPASQITTEGRNVAQELGALIEENEILRKDTIKLHYNLANMFFEQGKYEMAVSEYKRVTDLMPQDAATHYNLAFVSAEYLHDLETALKHYRRYVQLDPNAEDINHVKNKIVDIKMKLRSQVDSYINDENDEKVR